MDTLPLAFLSFSIDKHQYKQPQGGVVTLRPILTQKNAKFPCFATSTLHFLRIAGDCLKCTQKVRQKSAP